MFAIKLYANRSNNWGQGEWLQKYLPRFQHDKFITIHEVLD
jgi:hypothetical protein